MYFNFFYDIRLPIIMSENKFAGMKAQHKARVKLLHHQRAVEKFNNNLK